MTVFAIIVGFFIFLAVLGLAWKELGLAEFFADLASGLWNMLLSFIIRTFRIHRG